MHANHPRFKQSLIEVEICVLYVVDIIHLDFESPSPWVGWTD